MGRKGCGCWGTSSTSRLRFGLAEAALYVIETHETQIVHSCHSQTSLALLSRRRCAPIPLLGRYVREIMQCWRRGGEGWARSPSSFYVGKEYTTRNDIPRWQCARGESLERRERREGGKGAGVESVITRRPPQPRACTSRSSRATSRCSFGCCKRRRRCKVSVRSARPSTPEVSSRGGSRRRTWCTCLP